jgi:hypothetical protein
MSPEALTVLQNVLLDAIKILGPAAIAAFAAYRAGLAQVEVKLRELEKSNQFRARESIFTHLKDRLKHIDEQAERLNGDLGRMLGRAEAAHDASTKDDSEGFVRTLSAGIQSVARIAPLEVNSLLNDMQFSALTSTDEFKTLSGFRELKLDFSEPHSFDQVRSNTLEILCLYNLLSICTRLLLQKQMERVFSPYLVESK